MHGSPWDQEGKMNLSVLLNSLYQSISSESIDIESTATGRLHFFIIIIILEGTFVH